MAELFVFRRAVACCRRFFLSYLIAAGDKPPPYGKGRFNL